MKSWRLLLRANNQRLVTRAAAGISSKSVQFVPYQNLSYGALDACPSGSEGEQPRQPHGSWTPHVFGLLSIGLLLCGGRKGTLKCVIIVTLLQPDYSG